MFARILMIALVATVIWGMAAHSSSGAGHERVYVVKYGDTLWSIASARYGGDVRAGIWKLQQRNGLRGSTIVPGQRLTLPG